MSSCIEFYNVTNLPEIIDYAYDKYIDMNIMVCGVILLTSCANICIINSLNRKFNNMSQTIYNVLNPPGYK